MTTTATPAALAAFGRSVGANVLAACPAGFPVGPRIVAFAARTAAAKLRAQGYSAVDANVAALAAAAYVRENS